MNAIDDDTNTPSIQIPDVGGNVNPEDKWEPPAYTWIKLNIDASFSSNTGACAAVARNSEAKFKGGGTCSHNCLTPLEAETKTILLAMDLAEKKAWSKIVIESDAEIVIKVLNNEKLSYPWRIRQMVLQIRSRISYFNGVQFKFKKKGANEVAHTLASFAFKNHVFNWWLMDTPPPCIASLCDRESILS